MKLSSISTQIANIVKKFEYRVLQRRNEKLAQ